jgi:hypothetical protein
MPYISVVMLSLAVLLVVISGLSRRRWKCNTTNLTGWFVIWIIEETFFPPEMVLGAEL